MSKKKKILPLDNAFRFQVRIPEYARKVLAEYAEANGLYVATVCRIFILERMKQLGMTYGDKHES